MAAGDGASNVGEAEFKWDGGRNPYLHNLFALLSLDDPDAPAAEYNRVLSILARAIENADAVPVPAVYGRTPTEADRASAEGMKTDAVRLSVERLLVHAAHLPDAGRFEPVVRQLTQVDPGNPADLLPLPVTNVEPLVRRVPPLGSAVTAAAPLPDLSPLRSLMRPDPRDERQLPR